MARRKPRLVDKIAEGASMFLYGPLPTFVTTAIIILGQAGKGVKDNVDHYLNRRRKRGGSPLSGLASAARIEYNLKRDKRYTRVGAKGVTGSCKQRSALWKV